MHDVTKADGYRPMSNLHDILASATAGQYFTALVVLFGVYWLLSIIGFKQRSSYRLFYKRPRFPRLWNTAAWLFFGAAALSVFEFYAAGAVTWPDGIIRNADSYARSAYSYASDEVQALELNKEEPSQLFTPEQPTQLATAEIPKGAMPAKVNYVTDGDTVKVSTSEGKLKIRLQGIDAPEKDQRYGRTSTRKLKGLLTSTIYLDVDGKDRYGRTIATLYRDDGVNINAAMVCGGHAWWYKRYARFDSELRDCQRDARAASLGLWAAAEPVAPWEWRKR